jgi:hypothetical protein
MRKHILISYASDGVNDSGLDLTEAARLFTEAASSFCIVKVFRSPEVLAIAKEYGIEDIFKSQYAAFLTYLRSIRVGEESFKCNTQWLAVNAFLFKPLLMHFALTELANQGDIVTWHDCNVIKNPHYLSNVNSKGRLFLERRINDCSASFFSDTLYSIKYDIKQQLARLIYKYPLSHLLPSFRVNIISLLRDDYGLAFARLWLDLTSVDDYRLPFPDDLPQPKVFRHHSPEQATAFFAASRLCEMKAFRNRMNHTFLWNSTRIPPIKHRVLANMFKRSHIGRNLRLIRLLHSYPYKWESYKES